MFWLMIITGSLLVAGFVLLIVSADKLVVGTSALARRYKISELAIDLTIVAFGTSAPEMVVNVFAAISVHGHGYRKKEKTRQVGSSSANLPLCNFGGKRL